MSKTTIEEIAISEILKELLKKKEEKACLMLRKSRDLKDKLKRKFKNQVLTTRATWQCKENQN